MRYPASFVPSAKFYDIKPPVRFPKTERVPVHFFLRSFENSYDNIEKDIAAWQAREEVKNQTAIFFVSLCFVIVFAIFSCL